MRYFLALCAASLMFAAGPLSNRRAPGFSLMDSSGKQFDLQDYRGKIVLIDVMLTNCPHCRTFTKVLDRVVEKYGDRVAVLSVVNPPDSGATVSRFLNEMKPKFPILFDCGQMAISYLKVTPQNPAVDVPHLFIIDGNGWIVSDYAYSEANKNIFEASALVTELDRMLSAKPGKK
jgi:peroxiredoxin